MVLDFDTNSGNDSGGSNPGQDFGGPSGTDDIISRQLQFAKNVQSFAQSGLESAGQNAPGYGEATSAVSSPQTGQQSDTAWSGGLSPLQHLQLNEAMKVKNFADAGKAQGTGMGAGQPGSSSGDWETTGRNNSFGLGGGQGGSGGTSANDGTPQITQASNTDATAGSGVDAEKQRQDLDFFKRWKGLPLHSDEERRQAMVQYAQNQLATNPEKWAPSVNGLSFSTSPPYLNKTCHYKCNEFVYDVHKNGDPDGYLYPTMTRTRPQSEASPFDANYWKDRAKDLIRGPLVSPTVQELAKPEFQKGSLDYIDDVNQAQPGDIIVWHTPDGRTHHSAIYTGGGDVIQAGGQGLNQKSIEETSSSLGYNHPIVRRSR